MIDDEQVVLDVTKMYLEHLGNISLDCVLSASSGIEKLRCEKYDAIICDYDMDEIDGISFLKAIRGIYPGIVSPCPDIPFVIFTGKGDECIVIEALNSGADFYLQKGEDPKGQLLELAHKIEDVVSRRCRDNVVNDAFENTGTCMVIIDENGSVIRMNGQMADNLGILKDDLDSRISLSSFVSENDQDKVNRFVNSLSNSPETERGKKTNKYCEFYFNDMDGNSRPASANAAYVAEKKICIMSIAMD